MHWEKLVIPVVNVSVFSAVGFTALVYSPAVFGRVAAPIIMHNLSDNHPLLMLWRAIAALVIILGGPLMVWFAGAWIGLRFVSRISQRFVTYEVAK